MNFEHIKDSFKYDVNLRPVQPAGGEAELYWEAWECLQNVPVDDILSEQNGHSMSGAGQGLVVNTTLGLIQGSRQVLNDGVQSDTTGEIK